MKKNISTHVLTVALVIIVIMAVTITASATTSLCAHAENGHFSSRGQTRCPNCGMYNAYLLETECSSSYASFIPHGNHQDECLRYNKTFHYVCAQCGVFQLQINGIVDTETIVCPYE